MNLCAVLLLLVSIWPMYQYRPSHNAVFADSRPPVTWTHGFGGKINGGLALVGDVLYVESFDHRVTALDARTGRTIWSTRVPNVVMTTPIVADGVVVVGTGTNRILLQTPWTIEWGRPQGDYLLALNARTGRIVWKYRTVGEDMPTPALVRANGIDALVFANGDRHARAIALRTGHLLWETPVKGINTMSSAAAAGDNVFVNVAHYLYAFDPASGHIRWRVRGGGSDNSPAVAYGSVFVEMSTTANSFRNWIYAVDDRTGKVRWHWRSQDGDFSDAGSNEMSIAGLAADGMFFDSVQLTDDLDAFDAATGRLRWKFHMPAAVKMSPVEENGRLYFGDTGGNLYVVDARTGHALWRKHYPDIFTTSSPIIDGKTLYIANDKRILAMPLP